MSAIDSTAEQRDLGSQAREDAVDSRSMRKRGVRNPCFFFFESYFLTINTFTMLTKKRDDQKQDTVLIDNIEVPLFGNLTNDNLAVVDLGVLQKLTKHLPKTNSRAIIETHMNDCNELLHNHINGVDDEGGLFNKYTALLDAELRFHKTVNQITNYKTD